MAKLEFNKERDFTLIFNEGFLFIRQNFKALIVPLLYLGGPFILAAGALYGIYQSKVMSLSSLFAASTFQFGENYFQNVGLFALLFFMVTFLSYAVQMAIVFRYIQLYKERPEGISITVQDISSHLFADGSRMLVNLLVYFFVLILVMLVFVLIMAVFFVSPVLAIFGALILIVLMLLLLPNFLYTTTAGFYQVITENRPILPSFFRSWSLMRGQYWWTWLLMFCVLIGNYVASFIFSLPMSIMVMGRMFVRYSAESSGGSLTETIMYMAFGIIAYLGQSLLFPFIAIFCALQYHAHREKKEGPGIISKIDQIGNDF